MFQNSSSDESPESNDLAPTLGGQSDPVPTPVPRPVSYTPSPRPVSHEVQMVALPVESQRVDLDSYGMSNQEHQVSIFTVLLDYILDDAVVGGRYFWDRVTLLGLRVMMCLVFLMFILSLSRAAKTETNSMNTTSSYQTAQAQIDDAKRWMATHQKSMFFVVSRPNPPGYCEFVEIDQATEVAILAAAQHEGIPMIRGRFLPRLQNQYDALAEVIGQRADRRVLFCPARSATDSEWLCCQFVKGLPLASAVPIFASDGVRRVGRVYGDGVFSYGDN